MSDVYAAELEKILERYGFAITRRPELLKEILSKRFPERIMENHLIEVAVIAGIPGKLMETTITYSIEDEIRLLSEELAEGYSFKQELAEQAVQSWAVALGLKCSETLNKRVFL